MALFLVANAMQFAAHLTLGRMAREGSKRAAAAAAAAAAGAGTQGLAAATAAAAAGGAAGLEPVKVPLTALYSVPKGGMFELVGACACGCVDLWGGRRRGNATLMGRGAWQGGLKVLGVSRCC